VPHRARASGAFPPASLTGWDRLAHRRGGASHDRRRVPLPTVRSACPLGPAPAESARRQEVYPAMPVRFPSLEFFQGLQQRTKDDRARFEKLGYCDTSFGVRVGDELYSVDFEIYECTGVRKGGDPSKLDFVLSAPRKVWDEMVAGIVRNKGAEAGHTLNTLSHVGDVMKVEYADAEGHDKFYRYMASIQEFFDQAHHLDVQRA
jgi:hypothetical protein